MEELETLCQDQVEYLLEQKRILFERRKEVPLQPIDPDLPFYKTILPLLKTCEQQKEILFEIEEQIKKKKQAKELKEMRKVLASIVKKPEKAEMNPLTRWYNEMVSYDPGWREPRKDGDTTNQHKENLLYFYINLNENDDRQCLSYSTRYRGWCLRMAISMKKDDKCGYDSSKISCESSLGVNGTSLDDVIRAFSDNVQAEDYVRNVVWKGMESIIEC